MSKTFSKFVLTAGLVLAMAFTFSCSGDDEGGDTPSSSSVGTQGGGTSSSVRSSPSVSSSSSAVQCLDADSGIFTDSRDNKEYKYVTICSQTWFAENLDYEVEGSKCYDDDPANCTKYGRLYNWSTAMSVCPSGWHLPSGTEWTTLTNYVGSSAGAKLKATSGWLNCGPSGSSGSHSCEDTYGFSALPGSFGIASGSFGGIISFAGRSGFWWTATEYSASASYAWRRDMDNNSSDVNSDRSVKSNLFSVRCVQD
jgi:uncharacterized protein (TIGR02145 family)